MQKDGQISNNINTTYQIEEMQRMASSPITSMQIDRGKVKAVTDFSFLDSKITVDDDYSHKILKDAWSLEGKL